MTDQELSGLLFALYPEGHPQDIFGDGQNGKLIRENMGAFKTTINNYINDELVPRSPTLKASIEVIKGLVHQLGSLGLRALLRQNPAEIQKEVQWRLTKQLLIDKIQSALENGDTRDLLLQWVNNNTLEKCSQLVHAITGSATLGPAPLRFTVDLEKSNHLPVFHTCFNQMDLTAYDDYELFAQRLDRSIQLTLEEGEGMSME
jgi:hypothetical protein